MTSEANVAAPCFEQSAVRHVPYRLKAAPFRYEQLFDLRLGEAMGVCVCVVFPCDCTPS